MRGLFLLLSLIIGVSLPCGASAETFRQTNYQDVNFKGLLDPGTKAVVVVFMGTECPLIKQYIPTLARLQAEYKAKGILFYGVYSDKSVSVFSMAKHALEFDIPFTVVQDVESGLAKKLRNEVLSKAFLLDPAMKPLYQGPIDDQFGIGGRKPAPTQTWLKDAIEAVLAGKPVENAEVPARGCAIEAYNPAEKPAPKFFYGDVEPIMQKKCQTCHRPGEVGAVFDTFLTYEDVSNHAETIRQVVTDGRMPPSYTVTNPHYVKLRNDRRLTPEEVAVIDAWARNGAQAGDKSKALPPVKWPSSEWKIAAKPDRVLTMEKPYKLPATGILDYQFFKMKLNYPEDKWVTAMEIRPGNASVVHHGELHIVPSDDEDYSGTDGMMKVYGFSGDKAKMLAGFVPGDDDDNARVLPKGLAMKIPKNHDLVLEIHYTTNGKVTTDQTSAALVFLPPGKQPENEICNYAFRYPRSKLLVKAGEDHISGQKEIWFKKDVLLYTVRGHMHKIGKSWKLEWMKRQEDGSTIKEFFAGIPTWNFGWQRSFDFEEPILVKAGQEILMTGTWDNSVRHPYNANAKIDKRWGIQSDDEMLNTRVKYSIVNNPGGKFSCTDAVP